MPKFPILTGRYRDVCYLTFWTSLYFENISGKGKKISDIQWRFSVAKTLRKIISTHSPKCTRILIGFLCILFSLAKQANCPEMLRMHGLVFTVADSQVYFAFPAHLVLNHGREINTVPLKYFIFSLHLARFSKEMQGEKM